MIAIHLSLLFADIADNIVRQMSDCFFLMFCRLHSTIPGADQHFGLTVFPNMIEISKLNNAPV